MVDMAPYMIPESKKRTGLCLGIPKKDGKMPQKRHKTQEKVKTQGKLKVHLNRAKVSKTLEKYHVSAPDPAGFLAQEIIF